MLFDPARHAPLRAIPWDESRVRASITHIVMDTEARYRADGHWPTHANDRNGNEHPGQVETPLYHGECGVVWALDYLRAEGAVAAGSGLTIDHAQLLARNRHWLGDELDRERAAYLMGDTPVLLMEYGRAPTTTLADQLAVLIGGNTQHPSRELMWGAPGTLLAALFLHERTGAAQWAELFRTSAAALWDQLEWSDEFHCAYWSQQLYGHHSTYLDAVHGFVATALPLIRGRHLLADESWAAWQACIVNTVQRTATCLGAHANWRPQLDNPGEARKRLLQFCHGAPGFVVCLAALPDSSLDTLLLAAGETTWTAGPLAKGSNLCHGTGGNGYAFLKLHQRTGDVLWLERARAFAMHGITQCEEDEALHRQLRYSLWTGDLGFAIYLWDCVRADARFPTLDVFYARPAS